MIFLYESLSQMKQLHGFIPHFTWPRSNHINSAESKQKRISKKARLDDLDNSIFVTLNVHFQLYNAAGPRNYVPSELIHAMFLRPYYFKIAAFRYFLLY